MDGKKLLAHELSHVIQQTARSKQPSSTSADSIDDQNMKKEKLPLQQHSDFSSLFHHIPSIVQLSSQPIVMRAHIFTSTMNICRRLLKSRVFHVSQGGLIVTANAIWNASAEWEGSEPPVCGDNYYTMSLNREGLIFDSEYGSCQFAMGSPFSRIWTNLPNDDYYITIWTNNTNPTCCLSGDIIVSQESGLTGDTCTKSPPGPLEMLHDALTIAGFIPALGAVPDAINSGIYLIQGDWINAGISAVAIIPVFGDAASAVRVGERTVIRVTGESVERLGTKRIATGLQESRKAGHTAEVVVEDLEKAGQTIAKGKVGLDANAIMGALERNELAAVDAAISGRIPTISITAAKEFLKKGDVNVLRKFLAERGGYVGKAATKEQIANLQEQAKLLGRVLKSKDAAVAGSAITEGAEILSRDEKFVRFLLEAGIPASRY